MRNNGENTRTILLKLKDMVKQLGLDVLVVDDDYAVLELIERGLKEINPNLDVMTCLAAETALYLIDGGYTPDLVLVDFKLNGMNGVDFIKELRGRELGIPVAIFTGDVEGVKEMVSEGEGVGGVPVLTDENDLVRRGMRHNAHGAGMHDDFARALVTCGLDDAVDTDLDMASVVDHALAENLRFAH